MKPSYSGNAKPYVAVLFHPADETAVQPVLEELDSRDLTLCYAPEKARDKSAICRACALLAFVSQKAAQDAALETALLLARSENVPVICVYLEQAELPPSLAQALYTTNAIQSGRYADAAALCERIMTADALKAPALTPAQKRASKRVALGLIGGAAAVLVFAAVLLLRQLDARKAETEPVAAALTEEIVLPDVGGILAAGMTQKDLDRITALYLVGDQRVEPRGGLNWNWHDTVEDIWIDDERVWTIDGEEIPRGSITDLSLLGRMTNLHTLVLVNQSVTDLSPLRDLGKLTNVEIYDCPVESLDAFAGKTTLKRLDLHRTRMSDFSPLSGCTALEHISYNGDQAALESLSGLALPGLRELELYQVRELRDIAALSACPELHTLLIEDAEDLRDISALEGCTGLWNVTLRRVGARDLSPLASSRGLQYLELEDVPVSDLSFVRDYAGLGELRLFGTNIRDLDFLEGFTPPVIFRLGFSGDIDDYAGLAAIPYYGYLHVNTSGRSFSAVAPYLAQAKIDTLELYDVNGTDLTQLPPLVALVIRGGDLRDLRGISALTPTRVELHNMNYLTSLAGVAECTGLSAIVIDNCPRLTDIEELYARDYTRFELKNSGLTPDFSRLRLPDAVLVLDRAEGVRDLRFLETLPRDASRGGVMRLELRNMDWLSDLSPVQSLPLTGLMVPPQLAEQAEAMQEKGLLGEFEVAYPDDSLWQEDGGSFALLSLEELDTLPETMLQRVKRLMVIGDMVANPEQSHREEEWHDGKPTYYVVDNGSGERTAVGEGSIESFEKLGRLSGLEDVELVAQPLTSLQGIQNLQDLHWLNIAACPVADASPAFTLTALEGFSFFQTDITSLQGIQNLTRLVNVDVNNTQVSDLSPLAACDFSHAYENGGLQLYVSNIPCEDFSPLASIQRFDRLSVGDIDAKLWLPALTGKPVRALEAHHTGLSEAAELEAIAALPELRELHIPWNDQLTDLTPLLGCETLEKLRLSPDMEEARKSIEGRAHFDIEVQE